MEDTFFQNDSKLIFHEKCMDMTEYLWQVRQDPTTRPWVILMFAFLYSIIIVLGVLGNMCVILSISRTKSLQTVPNMFIFALSCSDIFVCFTSATITPITAFQKQWLFGRFFCSTAPFISGVSLCFSTFILAAISVDRFFLIRYPLKRQFTHKQALVVIIIICVFAVVFSLPMTFMQALSPIDNFCGEFCYEDWGKENQGLRQAYGTILLIVQFIIPLSIITFCYTTISAQLGKSLTLRGMKKSVEWQMPITRQHKAASKRRQRTNRMFIAMVFAFSLSWFWSVIFNLLRDYECLPSYVQEQEYIFGILTHWIAMTSTIWNPIFYALLNIQLRTAFIELIPSCVKNCLKSSFCTLSDELAMNNGISPNTKVNYSRKENSLSQNKSSSSDQHRVLEALVKKKGKKNHQKIVSFTVVTQKETMETKLKIPGESI